ncbi:ABC transporter ATP-binding protein [Phreatobacter cathodiphilus]|uniref:ABC transporter ATP-binding protein n=1 Tax=Phreatobacter cathodiphilus TaxID=1868589 RepID=A0A2S0N851_9HYPH|nr:ABC transporter ATP-binding protein [Phreatobacter cathodiphilus]AVO44339.1 ABC transporter ATP-binding protein [Phreatobacter cathodiphilus]
MIRIDIADLTIHRGGRAVVAGVTLALPSPGLVGIIGPNGAGKSTLARAMAGQPGARTGRVLVDGTDVATIAPARLAERIGYLPQTFQPHWDITARMLIALGARRAAGVPPGAVEAAIGAAGLTGKADRPWPSLSGGERAQALLAAVTVTDPPCLIADEPGASLDIRHRIALMRDLRRRGRTRLVVTVLHDLELATAFCDRLVLMEGGGVVAEGTPAEVVASGRLGEVFGTVFETAVHGGLTVARPAIGEFLCG